MDTKALNFCLIVSIAVFQTFKVHFDDLLASIEDEKSKQIMAEHRWTNSWMTSVQKVKDLY